MYHNPTQMDSYNKFPGRAAQGTLIANWQEERDLREHEGQGRANTLSHIPKMHQTLLYDDPNNLRLQRPEPDNTAYRLMGYQGEQQNGRTENYFYGKGTNKADTFNRLGRKQQLLEEMYLNQVKTQFAQQTQEQLAEAQRREFQTTNKDVFIKHVYSQVIQDIAQNTIGRRVMQDQSGKPVPFENIDQDLKTDHGFYSRKQITPDEELKKLLPQGHYSKQQPITFWTEKVNDGNFYMSKQTGTTNTQFYKNNEFLRTFKDYKHYKD